MTNFKARELPSYPKREQAQIPACEACGAFTPECVVPEGGGTLALCWLCAHAHVDHGCPLGSCAVHECECLPEDIYPAKVLADRRAASCAIEERERNAIESMWRAAGESEAAISARLTDLSKNRLRLPPNCCTVCGDGTSPGRERCDGCERRKPAKPSYPAGRNVRLRGKY